MPGSFRLATFNLESLDDRPDLEPSLDERVAVLRPQLERLHADILCLQEVNGQPKVHRTPRRLLALDRLIAGTAYAQYHRATTLSPTGQGVMDVHNLVILSRFPILAHRQIRNDLVPAPDYRLVTADPPAPAPAPVGWDRPILHARIAVAADTVVDVVNVHYRAPLAAFVPGQKAGQFTWRSVAGWGEGYFLAAMKRTGQAFETRMAIDAMFDRDEHALVCVAGDFNATLDEMPVRLVLGAEEDTGNGHLAGRSLVPADRGLAEDRRFSVIHHGHRQMLDHVLLSRRLLGWLDRVEVHNEGLGDELTGYSGIEHSPSSYHAPVVAAFTAPDDQAA